MVYKNAIANGLQTTQKLPIQTVKQFDDMIKHNDNPMNNNFWYLFTQLISQLTQMHKKINTAMVEWDRHFNKLNTVLFLMKITRMWLKIRKMKIATKKLLQNDAGLSQNKLYNKHKRHLLDECAKNMVKKLQTIPRHANNNKKNWTLKPKTRFFFTKYWTQKTKQNKKTNAKACAFATKKIYKIQTKKISLI